MIDTIYKISKTVAVVSVVPAMVCTAMFVWSLKQTSDQLRATTNALPALVDTRIDVLKKIDTVQDKLSTDIRFVARTADGRIGKLTTVVDTRLASIQTDTFGQVAGLRTDLNSQLMTTNQSVSNLTTAYASVPLAIGARIDKYTDCDTNDLCWQGQFTDTMFAARTASRDVSRTMAGINRTLPILTTNMTTISTTFATDVPKITGNFASITDNINRLTKPKWYDRLIGYGLNGAVLYRNINPATNLTVTGATFLTGK